jgi:flagellar biosynthesis/type III secretory pathway protein FliH
MAEDRFTEKVARVNINGNLHSIFASDTAVSRLYQLYLDKAKEELEKKHALQRMIEEERNTSFGRDENRDRLPDYAEGYEKGLEYALNAINSYIYGESSG